MSGLVSYQSSDEDDAAEAAEAVESVVYDHTIPSSASHSQVLPSAGNASTDASRAQVVADDLSRPIVGPAARPDGNLTQAPESASTPGTTTTTTTTSSSPPPPPSLLPPSMTATLTERDAIRRLTQAPVPMTSLPPSPPGSPDPEANARFARFAQLKAQGVHFNEDLARKSSFLNPGLLPTMMAKAGLEQHQQYDTVLPPEIWNPRGFPSWAYKEELLKSQQEKRAQLDSEKAALSAMGSRKIDFASASQDGSRHSSKRSTPNMQRKRRGH